MDIPYQLDLDKNTKIKKPRDLANDLNNDVYLCSMHMYICKYVLVYMNMLRAVGGSALLLDNAG